MLPAIKLLSNNHQTNRWSCRAGIEPPDKHGRGGHETDANPDHVGSWNLGQTRAQCVKNTHNGQLTDGGPQPTPKLPGGSAGPPCGGAPCSPRAQVSLRLHVIMQSATP